MQEAVRYDAQALEDRMALAQDLSEAASRAILDDHRRNSCELEVGHFRISDRCGDWVHNEARTHVKASP